MKQLILSLLCVAFVTGCSEKRITSVPGNFLSDAQQALTTEETKIFNSVKEDLREFIARNGLLLQASLSPGDIDKITVSTIPYYEFDRDKFFQNPVPERILECCTIPENKVMFLGKMNNKVVILFKACWEEPLNTWFAREVDCDSNSVKKILSWIPQKIKKPDISHCKLIKVFGLTQLAYTEGKKTTYYHFYSGREEACENDLYKYIITFDRGAKGLREFFNRTGGHAIVGDSLIPIDEFMKRQKDMIK